MSTLISRLGRRFREKKVNSTNLNLPGLPTPREILEDIECCQSGDPIIGLATLIQKKGRQSSLLDKDFFLEDPSISQDSSVANLAFLAPYQTAIPGGGGGGSTGSSSSNKRGSGGGEHDSSGQQGHHHQHHHKRKASLTLVTGGGGGSSKGRSKGSSDAECLNSYNKLKQFLLLFEKSEEILESLGPQFKRVEVAQKRKDQHQIGVIFSNKDNQDEECTLSVVTPGSSKHVNIKTSLNEDGDILKGEEEMERDDDHVEYDNDNHRRQLSESSDVGSSPLL